MTQYLETAAGGLPLVGTAGLNTNKAVDFSGAPSVALPAGTTIAGGDIQGDTEIVGTLSVGVDGTGHDVNFYGATSGQKLFWDESADTLFLPATVDIDGTVTVGVNDTGYDVKFFGATAGQSWLWDESADKMIVTGTSTLNGDVTLGTASGILSGTANGIARLTYNAVQNAVSTATAIGLTSYNTTIDSTSGALALTLAAGTFKGQERRVQMIVDNGAATLTFNTNATIVFEDVGDVAELVWSGTAWVPVALYNCADGATAPAYTPAS